MPVEGKKCVWKTVHRECGLWRSRSENLQRASAGLFRLRTPENCTRLRFSFNPLSIFIIKSKISHEKNLERCLDQSR